MGFFSDIISDARRASTAAYRISAEPGGERIQEHSLDDPGHVVAEALPQYQAEEMATAPRPDASHGARSLDDSVQPAAMPDPGRNKRDAVVPARGMVAEPDSLASVASLATVGKRMGPRIEPQNLQEHIEAEPARFLHPAATAGASAMTRKPASDSQATAGPEPAVQAEGRRAERKQAALPRRTEEAGLQPVAPQYAGAGDEAIAGAPASHAATGAASPQGVADDSPLARQEAAILGSVESRPVTPAPAAIDLSPVRRPGQSQGSAAGPQVHIGHIDIVVLAPEPARPLQQPLSAPADLASRHYLRRL